MSVSYVLLNADGTTGAGDLASLPNHGGKLKKLGWSRCHRVHEITTYNGAPCVAFSNGPFAPVNDRAVALLRLQPAYSDALVYAALHGDLAIFTGKIDQEDAPT
jgi:hypothetical protein